MKRSNVLTKILQDWITKGLLNFEDCDNEEEDSFDEETQAKIAADKKTSWMILMMMTMMTWRMIVSGVQALMTKKM